MLSGLQYRQISSALLGAFDMDSLRQLARYELDIDLDAVSSGDLEARTFALIDYAERAGRLGALIQGATRQNPGNEQLRAVVNEALGVVYSPKKTVTPVGYL